VVAPQRALILQALIRITAAALAAPCVLFGA
jgi:hypothetical protein